MKLFSVGHSIRNQMNTIEQMKQTTDLIKKLRPSYQPILDFYFRVFSAQENSRQDIDLPPISIEPDLLKIKHKNNMPLIDQSEFLIDRTAAIQLFITICDLAHEFAPKLRASALQLKKAQQDHTIDPDTLFSAILNNQSSTLNELALLLDVSEYELALFGYLSISPSIQTCSEQLKTHLDNIPSAKKMYCPICGNHPDMAFLDQNGKRHLKCCFCSHQWETARMGCVFCENTEKDMQHYFYNEEEKEYRVSLCDNCRRYIKIVDLRQMDRSFHPNIELISTLHLDMKAEEKGYKNYNSQEKQLYG